MSILNVNKINPVGGGSTITIAGIASVTGNVTATGTITGEHHGDASNLTSLPAANLTGTLPAISGTNLTNVSASSLSGNPSINTTGIITATAFVPTEGQLSHRNLIINGAMQVAQRGTSSTEPSNTYTLDRFKYFRNIDTGEVTVSQESVTDLTGFTKAAKINCTTAETGVPAKAGSKYAGFTTNLEAQDLQQLAYGTSGAKQITLSFYVKSNITGTFCVSIYKGDQTARVVSLGYTINSANTWERKTLTFPADTGGGGIDNNNGSGLQFFWILARQQGYQGTASTTWANNADSRFANLCTATIFENTNDHIFITGVQLEVGPVATPFEHRSKGDELARCQRYFQLIEYAQAMARTSTNTGAVSARFVCEMRAGPTIGTLNLNTKATNVGLNLQGDGSTNSTQSSGNQGTNYSSNRSMYLYDMSGFSGMSAGRTYVCGVPANNAVCFTASAEL